MTSQIINTLREKNQELAAQISQLSIAMTSPAYLIAEMVEVAVSEINRLSDEISASISRVESVTKLLSTIEDWQYIEAMYGARTEGYRAGLCDYSVTVERDIDNGGFIVRYYRSGEVHCFESHVGLSIEQVIDKVATIAIVGKWEVKELPE